MAVGGNIPRALVSGRENMVQFFKITGEAWLCHACRLVIEHDLDKWLGCFKIRWEDLILDRSRSCARCGKMDEVEPQTPVDMILICPGCGGQHIDAPDPAVGWTNPPHKSHLCVVCKLVWRPADVPTNGVQSIKTKGKDDNWIGVIAHERDA